MKWWHWNTVNIQWMLAIFTISISIMAIIKISPRRESMSLSCNLISWAQPPSKTLTLSRGMSFTFSQEWSPGCLISVLENSSPERLIAWKQWCLQKMELIWKAPWKTSQEGTPHDLGLMKSMLTIVSNLQHSDYWLCYRQLHQEDHLLKTLPELWYHVTLTRNIYTLKGS